ncbi:alkaline ceramidase [Planctomicrobium sp. SH664]|uniref:alkaline ceramidase n=1 Tax=Planctomicrobium sp. SH664 TaxID=3448125 RepID=UPI003F5AEB94
MGAFQDRLLNELSLPPENLIFSISHTHSVPSLAITDEELPGGDLHREWMNSLPERIVSTVREATAGAFDATLEWETGTCSLAAVRDFRDPNPERKRFLCGYSPEALADDTVLVGRITDSEGTVRGTIVNYACHPTTLAWQNRSLSPDYVGATREVIETATRAPLFFIQGASGDLAPRYQYTGDLEAADNNGRQLGYAVLSTLAGMHPPGQKLVFTGVMESGAPLALWNHQPDESSQRLECSRTSVNVPLRVLPTTTELQQAFAACTDRAQQERIRRKFRVRQALGDGTTYPLALYTWRIGDAVLVGSLAEHYSIFQQELRRRFPDHPVACANVINGSSLGYLPPAELYDEDIYPVWQTPFDRGSLELTLEAASQSIHDILST